MRMRQRQLKKIAAVLLTAAMCAGNLSGGPVVSAKTQSDRLGAYVDPEEISVIRIEPETLWEAAETAAAKGQLVIPPELLLVAEIENAETELWLPATPSDAEENERIDTYQVDYGLPLCGNEQFVTASYELENGDDLLADGEELPEDTKLRVFLEPDWSSDTMSLTGNENLIFMIINEGDKARGYQVQFDDMATDVLIAGSKSKMLKAYGAGDEDTVANNPSTVDDDEERPSAGDLNPASPSNASPGNASMAKEGMFDTLFAAIFNPIVAHAASKASPGNAEAEDFRGGYAASIKAMGPELVAVTGVLGSGTYTPLEVSSTSGLIKRDLETVGDGGMYMTAFALSEEEAFAAKKDNTSSVVMFSTSLSNFASVLEEGNGLFTINMYDYAPYSGTVSYTTRNEEGQTVQHKDVYNTYRNRLFINDYLDSLGLSFRFGRPVNSKVAEVSERRAYNDYSVGSGKAIRYYNITQGIPAAMDDEINGASFLELLFPDADVKHSFDVNGDGTEEDTEVIRVYNNISNGDGQENAFLKVIEDGDEGAKLYKGYWRYTSDTHKVEFNPRTHAIRRGSEQLPQDDPAKPDQTKWGFWPFGETDTSNKYYFGMTVDFDFYKEESGLYNPETKQFADKPMEYWFSGDDDILVYVTAPDGEETLALDLGGVHDRVSGSINFASGCITYETMARTDKPFRSFPLVQDLQGNARYPVTLHGDPIPTEGPIKVYLYDDKTDGELKAEGYADCLHFPRTSGIHHLKLYYMERGDGDSNYSMRFNLPVIPKSGLSLTKQLTGDAEQVEAGKNTEYQVDFVYSQNLDALKAVYHGGDIGEYTDVTRETIAVKGGETENAGDTPFLKTESYWFYLQERDSHGAEKTRWHVSETNGPKVEEARPDSMPDTMTSIYRVDAFSGVTCRFVCENIYGGPTPELSKRAWRDDNSLEATYDITLEVTGDSIYSYVSGNESEEASVKKAVVTDQLSQYVEPADTITVDGVTGPRMYLADRKATPSSPDKALDAGEKGTELKHYKAVALGNPAAPANAIQYSAEANGEAKVIYNAETKTITWYVDEVLEEDEIYTLTFKVEASDLALAQGSGRYPDQGDSDTGTHEGSWGYYSNSTATVEYETDEGKKEEEFPKPVIQPVNRAFSITKTVTGAELEAGEEYPFEVELHMEEEEKLTASQLKLQILDKTGNQSYGADAWENGKAVLHQDGRSLRVLLKKGETLKLTELPKTVRGYTVKESLETSDRYEVTLEKITHTRSDADIRIQELAVSCDFTAREQVDEMVFTNQYKDISTPPPKEDRPSGDDTSDDTPPRDRSSESEKPEALVVLPPPDNLPRMGDEGIGGYVIGLLAACCTAVLALFIRKRKRKYRQ